MGSANLLTLSCCYEFRGSCLPFEQKQKICSLLNAKNTHRACSAVAENVSIKGMDSAARGIPFKGFPCEPEKSLGNSGASQPLSSSCSP